VRNRGRGRNRGAGAFVRPGAGVTFVCALVFWLLVAPALATRGYLFEKALGASGSGPGEMSLVAPTGQTEPASGVAVDPVTHDVYVADTNNHRVDEFEASGAFVRAWGWGVGGGPGFEVCTLTCVAGTSGSSPGEFESPMFVAVDTSEHGNGDVYVGDSGDGIVSKFTAAGTLVESWGTKGQLNGSTTSAGSFGVLAGVAVGETGTLYVIDEASTLFTFKSNGKFTRQDTVPEIDRPRGLAVSGQGDLFKVNGLQTVEELTEVGGNIGQVTDTEASVGEHRPLATAGLAADPETEELFVDTGSEVARYVFEEAGKVLEAGGKSCPVAGGHGCNPTESFGRGDLGEGAGVAVDSSDASVFVADGSTNQVKVFALEPVSAPLAAGLSVTEVTDDSATLVGEVNPHGASTGFYVEYGPCALSAPPAGCVVSRAPVRALAAGSGFGVEQVAPIHIQEGLAPHTVYHVRLVAENEHGATMGAEQTFTTRGTGAFALPDDRQWQLVSPAARHGALIEPIGEQGVIQAAASGDALTYFTDAPTESNPAGYVIFEQALSTLGPEGWSTRDIEPPHVAPTGVPVGEGFEYRFFSEDLSHALVQPAGAFDSVFGEEASPKATEQTAFLRNDFLNNTAAEQCTTSCYEPLVTAAPAGGDVPEGTVFGQETASDGGCEEGVVYCGPFFLGASPDGEHVIVATGAALTATPATSESLYEWSAGSPASERLRLVSLLPANASGEVLPAANPSLGQTGKHDARHTVSGDGERVVWQSSGDLYLRENATAAQSPIGGGGECSDQADACTVQIGASLGGTSIFQTANREATKIFFTNAGDLYEYDVEGAALNRLTENGEVQGDVIGASEDGAWVYFVANGVLGDAALRGASRGDCGEASGETCNLYAYHDGTITLVAVLSGGDAPDWASEGDLSGLTARVSPDGEWLAFMSQRSLTGYDNRDANSGQPDEEVYEYNAATERIVCASCNPTGTRPAGREYKGIRTEAGGVVGGFQVWAPTTWIAGNVPGWTPFAENEALYQSRYLSDEGRLFFDSSDALVPLDINGTENVYEFEPQGVGTCEQATSSGSVVFSPAAGGCVGLISSGSSTRESAFLDASESGGDVFILTTDRLSPLGEGGREIYDAHECTSQAPCLSAPVGEAAGCEGEESCKAPPSRQPEIYGAAGSATVTGSGNFLPSPPAVVVEGKKSATRAQKLAAALKACRRDGSRKRRLACEHAARRKYGAKAKKSSRSSRKSSNARFKASRAGDR
jgi:DNA-binding beta-propeller fold protein YncE